jgi:hypothetical protein
MVKDIRMKNKPSLNNLVLVNIVVLGCTLLIFMYSRIASTPIVQPSTTPTVPAVFSATVSQPTFCHNGPSQNYLGVVILPAQTEVNILAISDASDWFLIRGIGIDPCWIQASFLMFPSNFDFTRITTFTTTVTIANTPCFFAPAGNTLQTVIPKDWRIVVYGKSETYEDWVLVIPHSSTQFCWVQKTTISGFNDLSLPFEPADFALEPTPTATATPTTTKKPVIPTETLRPTATKDSNSPASTPIPTNTPGGPSNTPISTNTPVPSNTPIPPPTNTPLPTTTPTLCWPPGKCK